MMKMKGMKLLIYVFTAIVGSFVLFACGDNKQAAQNPANIPIPVNLHTVTTERARYYDKFPGTIVAMMQVDIRAQAEGYVTGIYFTEGSRVSKGQKLYTIDDRKYQATYNQSQANVHVAEANLAQAQKDADRYTYLNQHEAVAKQTLDHAMTTLQNAKQQLAAAKQELTRTQTDVGYSVINAPFDGTIGISQVKVGNTVVPGQTVLNTISTTSPMAVDFVVNEKQISRFLKLQNLKNDPADSIFTIQLPDNSIYNYPARIHVIDRGVNPQTGTITVRLTVPDPSSMLRAGMSCLVRVRNDDTAKQILIPYKAVVEQMGEYFVYVARDSASVLSAVQKKVTPGQTIADQVIIKTGLEAGERLITDGVQKLHDGSLITIGEQKNK